MTTPLAKETGAKMRASEQSLTVHEGVVATISQGSYLLIDVVEPGSQLYMILLCQQDPTERLSLAHTRIAQGHLFLGPMSNLISNRRTILARICEDDVRSHDILSSSTANVTFPKDVVATLQSHGIPEWSLPDGIDFFTSVTLDPEGRFCNEGSRAQAGDRLALLLATDVVCAMVLRTGGIRVSVRHKMVPYGADRHD